MKCLVATSYRQGVGKLYLAEITALRREFYEFHKQFGSTEDLEAPPEKWWGKDVTFLLFMVDDKPIGYIRFFPPVNKDFYISSFVITAQERGKGHGREALRLAKDYFKKRGGTNISIGAAVRNQAALGLYKSFGFNSCYLGLRKKVK